MSEENESSDSDDEENRSIGGNASESSSGESSGSSSCEKDSRGRKRPKRQTNTQQADTKQDQAGLAGVTNDGHIQNDLINGISGVADKNLDANKVKEMKNIVFEETEEWQVYNNSFKSGGDRKTQIGPCF